MELRNLLIGQDCGVVDALARLDETARGMLIVVDESNTLVGTLTDGDIRRCILKTGSLSSSIDQAVNDDPVFIYSNERQDAPRIFAETKVKGIPVVDIDNVVVDCLFADDELSEGSSPMEAIDLPVVMMAGGKGTRLYPYTKILPKPLIPINDVPIAERIITQFNVQGCESFILIVNHKKEMIKAYFNELQPDYRVEFVEEQKFLGTGGGLSLLKGKLDSTFILTNCDILVEAEMANALELHRESGNAVTIIASLKNYQIPYGTVQIDEGGSVAGLDEKPSIPFLVNTGCYVVEPKVIDLIKDDECIGFPDIIERCKSLGLSVGVYPISESSWMDMGQLDEMRSMAQRLESRS